MGGLRLLEEGTCEDLEAVIRARALGADANQWMRMMALGLRRQPTIEVVDTMSKDKNVCEGQCLGEKIKSGEWLMERAKQVLRRYHKAQGTQPAREVEKLCLEAKALFAAVGEYQRQVLGGPQPRLH